MIVARRLNQNYCNNFHNGRSRSRNLIMAEFGLLSGGGGNNLLKDTFISAFKPQRFILTHKNKPKIQIYSQRENIMTRKILCRFK